MRPASQAASQAADPHQHEACPGHGHWQAGCGLVRRKDWRGAAKAFARATHAGPADALYWIYLANAERHAGEYARAEAAARRALSLQADEPLALQVLADRLAKMHRYAESVQAFARLEACGQVEPEALVMQASMLQALDRQGEAVDVLLRALAAQPHRVPAHALLADAFRALGLKREAVECMKTVLALEPGNLEALSHLSFAQRHLCDWRSFDSELQTIESELGGAEPGRPRVAAVLGLLSLPLAPELLAGYKKHLTENRLSLPLFDTARYTREFEQLLVRMVQRWRAGLAPEHLLAESSSAAAQ